MYIIGKLDFYHCSFYVEKTCLTPECSETDLAKFRKMGGGKYTAPRCIECERKIARERRKERYHNPETKIAIKAQNKAYSSKPERIALDKNRNREHYLANSEIIKSKNKAYKSQPEVKARRNLLWRERYPLERDERRASFKERYHADPEFRLRGNIRTRVCEALNSSNGHKDMSVLKALDYSIEELKFHLESQFISPMSWENRKSFSVDHIIPQSMFKYTSLKDEQFRLCWSLDNLRLLPPSQNFSEGNRKHLFGGCSDWEELVSLIRSWGPGSELESVKDVFDKLSSIQECSSFVPYSKDGIGYLDSIFRHRFKSRTNGKNSLESAYNDDFFLLKIISYIISSGRPISKSLVYRNSAFLNKTPSHFFPSTSSSLVKKYAFGGDVVDPFLGWGGRTLGAICGGAKSICGTDLQEDSVFGCKRVVKDLEPFNPIESEFIHSEFSKYLFSTDRKFDFLVTSPPFMSTEDYGSPGFGDIQSWRENIVEPLVMGSIRVIKSGGYVAVHGQDKKNFPILTTLKTSFSISEFEKIDEFSYGKSKGQSIVVFRKK